MKFPKMKDMAVITTLGAAFFASNVLTGQEYDGAIVDSYGKAVMGSVAIGVGEAFRDADVLDTLTDVRLSLIKADMSKDMRESLKEAEEIAYRQAAEGDWTIEGLNSWIDTMVLDRNLIDDLVTVYGEDIKEKNWARLDETIEDISQDAINPEGLKYSMKILVSLESTYAGLGPIEPYDAVENLYDKFEID